ncbi:hypothetical protein Q9L58_008794 [Maublancomyces gigas]|uniref:Uncharacterized protein n=1 Tax=Discina gigas TaxID=1032678 RepID=A0ABR3G8N3_9PEZI
MAETAKTPKTPACPASEIIVSPGTDFVRREVHINFPDTFTDETSAQFVALQENVFLLYSWAINAATDLVKRKIKEGSVPEGDKFAESSYRAKVMSSVFQNRSPWLILDNTPDVSEAIETKVSEFKAELLLRLGRQVRPTPPEWAKLPEFIEGYGQRVLAGVETSETPPTQYWFLVTVFRYDEMVREFKATLRMYEIMLGTTREKAVVAEAPASTKGPIRKGTRATVDMVTVNLLFHLSEYEFNNELFEASKIAVETALARLVAKNS